MTAIAYVSDEKMLEYHRFNGSQSIVFWRLSNKKFSNFKQGDLLFFLANTKERKKEKGLVGYGCFKNDSSMSIKSMWNKYGSLTGYSCKSDLEDAIIKSNKAEELPNKISCLSLDKVVFFASPIFLSDLGQPISNKLESFTYLDGPMVLNILSEAKEIGFDVWSSIQNSLLTDEQFEQQLYKYQVLTISDEIGNDIIIPKDKAEEFVKDKNIISVNDKYQYYIESGSKTIIYCLYYTNPRNEKNNFYRFIGMMNHLKMSLKEKLGNEVTIRLVSCCLLKEYQEKIFDEFNKQFN